MKTKTCPVLVLLAFGLTMLPACRSASGPGSTSHASVQIEGQSLPKIQQTIGEVFREEGYAVNAATTTEMIFDRPGSSWDAAKWGGWTGEGVIMRVKVQLRTLPGGACLLQADAYAVQKDSDPFFQTESRNALLSRRPYQKLLDEVADRMK